MLELEQALERILQAIPPATFETIALPDADGRISGETVSAKTDLPAFNNSSMDGYAVRASDTRSATPSQPVRLRLIGRVAAGESFTGQVDPGSCIRLFTGSPLPQGADAVVMQEDTITQPSADQIGICEAAAPGENVRFKGEDVRAGTALLEPGASLSAGSIALLAAAGVSQVKVGRRPTVALLPTGSELRPAGERLGPGQIFEANQAALCTLVQRAGGLPHCAPIVPDSLPATREALSTAFGSCEIVVTCGGVSVGELDYVKAAFEALGGKLEFWKVAIKPGKPFVFGNLGNRFLFGLPGNPVSALVTFLLLVRPALRRWQGPGDAGLRSVDGIAAAPIINNGDRRHFIRVHLDNNGAVRPSGIQASHVLSSLARANGLVDTPPNTTRESGTKVRVLLW
jgi:molybdopterin molybdotransferase